VPPTERESPGFSHGEDVNKVTTFGEEDAPDDAWTVATAKARLSEVIDRARTHGPQLITRNGRPAAVVVGADEWERKTRRVGSLAEFFASSPLRERVDLQVERSADRPRAVTKFLLDTNAVSEWAKPLPTLV